MRCALVLVAVFLVVTTNGTRVHEKRNMLTPEKRAPASTEFGLLDLLFKYGDTDESDSLDYFEVRELFCGRIFSVNINDIMVSIMDQDANKDSSIDLTEWKSIVFSDEEQKTFDRSPYINILA